MSGPGTKTRPGSHMRTSLMPGAAMTSCSTTFKPGGSLQSLRNDRGHVRRLAQASVAATPGRY